MTDYGKLYDAISKIAWGYIFIHLDINLGTIDVLPNFVGYLLFLAAISVLKEEERDLALLRPFGIVLALWAGMKWAANCLSISFDDMLQLVSFLIGVISIYFTFQMLTNLASIARKYQPGDRHLDAKLLKYRTAETVLVTGTYLLTYLYPWLGDVVTYPVMIMAVVTVIVGICLVITLFDLRKCFKDVPENEVKVQEIDVQDL